MGGNENSQFDLPANGPSALRVIRRIFVDAATVLKFSRLKRLCRMNFVHQTRADKLLFV